MEGNVFSMGVLYELNLTVETENLVIYQLNKTTHAKGKNNIKGGWQSGRKQDNLSEKEECSLGSQDIFRGEFSR